MIDEELNKSKYSDVKHARDYAKYRLVYPKNLFEIIMGYVHGEGVMDTPLKLPLAVDVGCGPGIQSTALLAPYFDKVLGIDTSESQISHATELNRHPNLEFKVSSAENMLVADKSANLVMSAVSLHWFDAQKFYKECDRVLVPGGAIAAFSHSVWHIINHPNAAAINKVVFEIWDTVCTDVNPYYDRRNNLFKNSYRSESVQIPYKDKKRVDGIPVTTEITLENLAALFRSLSFCRDYIAASKEHEDWWKSCVDRLVAACGATALDETLLIYQVEVFMLLGRKPL